MLFFRSRDKLFHVKHFRWLVTSSTAFKIDFSLSSLKIVALLLVWMSDEVKLYLLRQGLHIYFLQSVINCLLIRILNELSRFIESLMFDQVILQIYHGSDNHKRIQIFLSSLAGLMNVHFCHVFA